MKKAILFLIFSSIFSFELLCQSNIGFFMAVSDSSDSATIDLTQDLYFQKLSLLPNITVFDFRNEKFDLTNISDYSNLDYIFFPEIQENGLGWNCTFHAIDVNTKATFNSTIEYDSYYMILMDAKKEITVFFDSLSSKINNDNPTENQSTNQLSSINNISIETLSGTWEGEEFIDKIVILRGGRGFVIYENGASMNISLKIENNNLIATQISKSNASYFPEISREKALELAPSAEPIKWTFNIKNSTELEGTKHTLAETDDQTPNYTKISVKWKKL
mgnify:FL=1